MINKERRVGVYPKIEYNQLGKGQFLRSKFCEIEKVVKSIEQDYGKENIMHVKSTLSFVTTKEESSVIVSVLFNVK